MADRPESRRRLSLSVDLSGVLTLIIVGTFGLIAVTLGWGLITGEIDFTTVVAVLSTMLSGVVAGALAAARKGPPPTPPQVEEPEP